MIIGVNARYLLKKATTGIEAFTYEVLIRLTEQQPRHRFIFFFDRPPDELYNFSENVTPVILSPKAQNPLAWKYWFDIKVAAALKKFKADVFLSLDGFCSLTTNVPQCIVVHNLNFLHDPDAYKGSLLFFYKYFTPKFIKKAKQVFTISGVIKNDIANRYKTGPEKIKVVYTGVNQVYEPVSSETKNIVKQKYTEGREYFIYTGAINSHHNLILLLKAFSIFKKRQQSNWKLVLTEKNNGKNNSFQTMLQTYKYRDDVVLIHSIDEAGLVQLTASAYAAIYLFPFNVFDASLLQTMNCGVPCLIAAGTVLPEIGETAALTFDASNTTDIADKLMLIYKDENLRAALIEKGVAEAQKYTWQRTTDLVWKGLMEAVG